MENAIIKNLFMQSKSIILISFFFFVHDFNRFDMIKGDLTNNWNLFFHQPNWLYLGLVIKEDSCILFSRSIFEVFGKKKN